MKKIIVLNVYVLVQEITEINEVIIQLKKSGGSKCGDHRKKNTMRVKIRNDGDPGNAIQWSLEEERGLYLLLCSKNQNEIFKTVRLFLLPECLITLLVKFLHD